MIAKEWTLSGLSVELKRDRRTIAKSIDKGNVQPVRADNKAKYYRMADVVAALFDVGDLNLEQERAKLTQEQTRKTKRLNDLEERKVISREEVIDQLQQVSRQAVAILEALPLNIKRRVPILKARDIGYIRLEIAKSRNLMADIEVNE